jgi:hypothetical protein
MFEFGDKTSGKSWYYEGPQELTKIANAVLTGSIDTTAIDPYRQGVELTQQQHWSNGVVKIHVGDADHRIRQNIFGQSRPRIDNDSPEASWHKDVDYFDPIKYVQAQTGGMYIPDFTFPIITSDIDEAENYVFNGVIEPFAIRAVVSFFSLQIGQEMTGIKGEVMEGNSDPRLASESVVHVHAYEIVHDATPFLDMIDMIANVPTVAYYDNNIAVISPFVDANSYEITVREQLLRNSQDMCNAINSLEFATENYVPTGSMSPTSGVTFDNTHVGTDSLAFGGMTYDTIFDQPGKYGLVSVAVYPPS